MNRHSRPQAGGRGPGSQADLVYAGFSMGADTAECYTAARPGARGASLMHSMAPLKRFGVETWPNRVPVGVHYTVDDGLRGDARDVDELRSLARAAEAPVEIYEYPRSGHLFADPDGPDYDRAQAEQMLNRQLAFLERVRHGRREPRV